MLVKTCLMELRPRLRSCNVFITTTVDLRRNCNLKINILSDMIILNYSPNESEIGKCRSDSYSSVDSLSDYTDEEYEMTQVIPIDKYCIIIPNSMSGLKVDKNDVSFRILTEGLNGDFHSEIITQNDDEIKDKFKINIDVKPSVDTEIICANCLNAVSNGLIRFDRVLELPSEHLDITEWFCHGHCSSGHNLSLKFNKNDFLYRLSYFLVDSTVLSDQCNKFNAKREIYHCNRCLAWLGTKTKDNSIRFYNSTVKTKINDDLKTIFKYEVEPFLNDVVRSDFIYVIEQVTKEFNLGMQYSIMCKLLLECSTAKDEKKYLLIWVMDKELRILKGSKSESEILKLKSIYSTKVLYKVENTRNECVESWFSEPGVASTEISKNMFQTGIEHLEKMSMKVPESFRVSNGFRISYLKL